MHTVFALLCFVVVIHWLIFPYPSGLLHWHCGNLTIAPCSASKATLMNMDTYFMWIHYERLHNHNKAKHNKTVCIFLGIYCTSVVKFNHAVNLCHVTMRNRRLNSKCILTHPWRQIVSFRSVSLRKLLSVLSLSGVSLSPSAVLITIRYWSKLMITGIYDTASKSPVVLCV